MAPCGPCGGSGGYENYPKSREQFTPGELPRPIWFVLLLKSPKAEKGGRHFGAVEIGALLDDKIWGEEPACPISH